MCDECVHCGEEVDHTCVECEGCEGCCECNSHTAQDDLDDDWDEDFGGYPDEEPARWARHCRAMQRARDEGVD